MPIELYNESLTSIAALPPTSADLIIIHPPWGVHTFSSDPSRDGFEPGSEFDSIICAAMPLLRPQGTLIVGLPEIISQANTLLFCPQVVERTLAAYGFQLDHVDFWLKVSSGKLHAGGRWNDSKCDRAVAHSILEWLMVFRIQPETSRAQGRVFALPVELDPVHPAVWPYALAYELVSTYSDLHAHVVDPFMGRGTIARACIALNRRFTGFEIHAEYFQRAIEYVGSGKHANRI